MTHNRQKRPKPKIVRTCHYNCAHVRLMALSNNLPCYPPDSHQSHDALYSKTGDETEIRCQAYDFCI